MKTDISGLLQPFIYDIIKDELARVEEMHRAPVSASHNVVIGAVQTAAEEAIEQLKADGLITSYENINKIPMYQIVERK